MKDNVDFTQLGTDLIVDMEAVDLTENGQQTITLDAAHVESMTDADNTLLVNGDTTADSKDTVNLSPADGWASAGSQETVNEVTYNVHSAAAAATDDTVTVKVEDGVECHIV